MNFRGIRTQQGTDALLPPPLPWNVQKDQAIYAHIHTLLFHGTIRPGRVGTHIGLKRGGGTKPSDTVKKHFFYLQFVFTVILLCFFKKPHKLISLLKHPTYTLWSALQVKICSKLYNGQFLSLQSKHFV